MSRITGTDAANLIEAYNSLYAPQEEVELTEEQVQEDFENWVNSLVEEGYDLSEYTWEDMYEEYITEIGVNFGGQKAVDAVRARSAQQQQSAARLDTLRAQRFGAGSYRTASPAPTGAQASTKPAPAPSRFGTTTPKGSSVTSTGVSGLSPADRAAYSAGGGNAAAQKGMGRTTAQVIAQGRANLGRMDQGRPAPAAPARPAATTPARPATAAPKPASAPAAPAKPASTATRGFQLARQGVDLSKTSAPTPAAPVKKPSLASQSAELRAMQAASRQRQGLTQSFDVFDVIKGHLIDEGYADTEETALVIMANMSEEWKNQILDSIES